MYKLKSFAQGHWHQADADFKTCHHALTGKPVAQISSSGLNFAEMRNYARDKGQKSLAKMTFHERALMLKELALHLLSKKEDFYRLFFKQAKKKVRSVINLGKKKTIFYFFKNFKSIIYR
jgi:oxepin-CoA hydrolase/3-oxo-5,6-dehydrosuberyl-CoA semialdehyde dehydrogenase